MDTKLHGLKSMEILVNKKKTDLVCRTPTPLPTLVGFLFFSSSLLILWGFVIGLSRVLLGYDFMQNNDQQVIQEREERRLLLILK